MIPTAPITGSRRPESDSGSTMNDPVTPVAYTESVAAAENNDPRPRAEKPDPIDNAEQVESTDPTEFTDPTDANDPTLAMLRMESRLAIEKIEPLERQDRREGGSGGCAGETREERWLTIPS